jgi:diguanylate cyclase (GGDEF)-like protein
MPSRAAPPTPLRPRRWAPAWLCALALALAGGAAQALAPPQPMERIRVAAEDDPHAALSGATQALNDARQRGDSEGEFWLLLALARVQQILEDPAAALRSSAQARGVLERLVAPPRRWSLWLELGDISAALSSGPPRELAQRLAALRPQVEQLGDAALLCDLVGIDVWLLQDARSHDEAWLAAEALERCSQLAGQVHGVARARIAYGGLASAMQPTSTAATEHLARALQALGDEPARFRRSVIEWEIGLALRDSRQFAQAMPHLARALAISREIGDAAGIAAADIALADVLIELGSPAEALAPLREAQALLQATEDGFRMPGVYELRIRALALRKSGDVLAEINAARRWDGANVQPAVRARLARAMAEGYAAVQQFGPAYAELQRAHVLEQQGKEVARDEQVLRLQTRYDAAQRDAENVALRHQSQSAQLQLQAQAAQQRALWAALATLLLVLGGLAYAGGRLLARRRVLADLALRDELTGQPNRRSVMAYAQAQMQQTQRLGGPMSVAMIDLDHFKRVNDQWGHAVGDAVLRAFAVAISGGLRGQDRLGRWGGEEWLLVMPGTTLAEMGKVFERLRQRFADMPIDGLPGRHGFTFSMGGAELRADTPHLQALIAEADCQLYAAKSGGRDTLRPMPGGAPSAPPALFDI